MIKSERLKYLQKYHNNDIVNVISNKYLSNDTDSLNKKLHSYLIYKSILTKLMMYVFYLCSVITIIINGLSISLYVILWGPYSIIMYPISCFISFLPLCCEMPITYMDIYNISKEYSITLTNANKLILLEKQMIEHFKKNKLNRDELNDKIINNYCSFYTPLYKKINNLFNDEFTKNRIVKLIQTLPNTDDKVGYSYDRD